MEMKKLRAARHQAVQTQIAQPPATQPPAVQLPSPSVIQAGLIEMKLGGSALGNYIKKNNKLPKCLEDINSLNKFTITVTNFKYLFDYALFEINKDAGVYQNKCDFFTEICGEINRSNIKKYQEYVTDKQNTLIKMRITGKLIKFTEHVLTKLK